MNRQLAMCCAAIIGAGLSLASATAALAQPDDVLRHQYKIKTSLVYHLARLIRPNMPVKVKVIRIAVVGQAKRRQMVLDQPVNNPALRASNGTKLEWKGFDRLDDNAKGFKPDVIYFLRDDPRIIEQLEAAEKAFEPPASLLIITEQDDKLHKGAAVNLFEDKAVQRFVIQILKKSLEDRGLQADPQLLKLPGVLVY